MDKHEQKHTHKKTMPSEVKCEHWGNEVSIKTPSRTFVTHTVCFFSTGPDKMLNLLRAEGRCEEEHRGGRVREKKNVDGHKI
jgi:hypothetical protein